MSPENFEGVDEIENIEGEAEEISDGMEKSVKEMRFSSIEEAQKYYQDYGNGRGFNVRKRGSYATKRSGVITQVEWTCSCEGTYKPKADEGEKAVKKRKTSTIRTNCKARMCIGLDSRDGTWCITAFRDKHNHAMVTPSKRVHMRSNRSLPAPVRNLAEAFSRQKLKVGKVPSLFGSNVGFNARDVYNHMRTVRKSTLQLGDASEMVSYFRKKCYENPFFYYAAQQDKEGKAANFFWVDARSRMAYSRFGDAVTFDTTYMTNKYSLPFGPFTGVNHHNQSVLFGFALIQDETEETFTWLFETWLDAMGGKPPISIITDQDLAMTKAIAKVFPNSRHRFCLWHIKKKFAEKMKDLFQKKSKFKQQVKRVTRFTTTIEDFETQWASMLVQYNLQNHEWLTFLYSIREKWIPVFNRGTFFAGMNTTQRSESMNSFFDHFVDYKTSLREFVLCCEQALERMYEREREEYYKSIHKNRIIATEDLLVKHASNIYTRTIFNKVAVEFNQALRFWSDVISINGDESTWNVYSKSGTREEFIVRMNQVTKEGVCGCQLFSFMGIPCKHLHHVLVSRLFVDNIPPHFIMNRWLKTANKSEVEGYSGLKGSDIGVVNASRINHYCRRSTELAYMLGKSEEAYNVAMEHLEQVFAIVKSMENDEFSRDSDNDPQHEPPSLNDCAIIIGDPPISQTKGRKSDKDKYELVQTAIGTVKRRKSGIEISTEKKKPRVCKLCHGSGHDSRNCLKIKSQRQSIDVCPDSDSNGITDLINNDK